jgi:hypothetical protein
VLGLPRWRQRRAAWLEQQRWLTWLTLMPHTVYMSDVIDQLIDGFKEGLSELPHELVVNLSPEDARAVGTARTSVAALIWASKLGEMLTTTEVASRLQITRQALAKRLAAGTILGIVGRSTTHYPVWQFDPVDPEVRPDVREIFKIFMAELGSLDARTVSSWMMTPSQDLHGICPHDWLLKRGDQQTVYDAARRVALRLAS